MISMNHLNDIQFIRMIFYKVNLHFSKLANTRTKIVLFSYHRISENDVLTFNKFKLEKQDIFHFFLKISYWFE